MFLAKKLFRPIIFRIIEFEKPQGTIYKVAQAIVTVIVRVIRSFVLAPTMSMRTISQKKSIFPRKNSLGQFFYRSTEYGRLQVTFC